MAFYVVQSYSEIFLLIDKCQWMEQLQLFFFIQEKQVPLDSHRLSWTSVSDGESWLHQYDDR